LALPCNYLKSLSMVLFLIFPLGGFAETAEPKVIFKKEQIKLGGKTITVEVAETDEQRARGLMYRESLPANGGMIFIFNQEQTLTFWMKNTYIDLSIGFFDKNQTLVDMQEMKKTSVVATDIPTYTSKKPALYALEMNKGWFSQNKIKIGTRFNFKNRRR
jgi:uncharacterized membrane protein (UPF0127 family)